MIAAQLRARARQGLARLGAPRVRRLGLRALGAAIVVGTAVGVVEIVGSTPDQGRPTVAVTYHLTATTDDGAPAAGVELRVGDRPAGRTDEHGELTVPLRGPVGAAIPLHARCPAPLSAGPALPAVVLRPPRAGQARGLRLEATFTCERPVRRAAIVVRAQLETSIVQLARDGARQVEAVTTRPLTAVIAKDGAPLARTDVEGLAQLVLERPPGSTVQLVLHPQDAGTALAPVPLELEVGAHDDVFTFDQVLRTEVVKAPPPRRRHRGGGATRPRKIQRVVADAPFRDL